jgi:hypothetical protein
MYNVIMNVYNAGFSVWNALIGVAVTMFTTSPTSANGSVYGYVRDMYNAITDIALPIAIVFFLIAICKDVISTPPESQVKKMFGDGVKLCIMIGLLANLWDVMGYIMQIADGITGQFATAGSSSYDMSASSDLTNAVDEICNLKADFPDGSWSDLFSRLGEYIGDLFEVMCTQILALIAAGVTFGIIIASGISIISSAFQRILKPLAIMPFASVMVAMAAGSNEAERVATSYIKSFFGLCLSGAFMVICVKLGAALTTGGLIAFDVGSMDATGKMLFIAVQNMVTPIVISGLVKQADSMLGRFL